MTKVGFLAANPIRGCPETTYCYCDSRWLLLAERFALCIANRIRRPSEETLVPFNVALEDDELVHEIEYYNIPR